MGEQMVKFHIDLWVEVCPWRVVFENQQLAASNWHLAGKNHPFYHRGRKGTQRKSSELYANLGE